MLFIERLLTKLVPQVIIECEITDQNLMLKNAFFYSNLFLPVIFYSV